MRYLWAVGAVALAAQIGLGCDITNRESAYRNMIKDQQLLLKAQQAGDLSRQEELLKDLITCGEYLKLDTSFYQQQLVKVKQLKNNPPTRTAPILKPKEELKSTPLQLQIEEKTTYPVDKVIKIRHRSLKDLAGEEGQPELNSTQSPPQQTGGAATAVGFGKVFQSWPEVVIGFPNPIQVRHFTIEGKKYKEVFDLFPAKVARPYFKTLPNKLRLKVAQFKPEVVRVVVEGSQKFPLYYRSGEGLLQLGFRPFKKKLPRNRLLNSSSEQPNRKEREKPDSQQQGLSAEKYRDTPLPKRLTQREKEQKVIVIDPGHGGKDPGGVGYRKIKEKQIVLGIAEKLAKILRKRGYRVFLTRDRDRFIELKERTRFANKKRADLFISIHGNIAYHHNPRLRGIEVYYLSPTKNERAIRVAMEENKEIKGLNYLDQRVILNFLNKDRIVASHKFGIDVMNGIYRALKKRYPVRKNGVRGGPFWVLVGTQMPSILIEVGYLTNPTDAKLLKNPKYQHRLAIGIADGIEAYFRKNR